MKIENGKYIVTFLDGRVGEFETLKGADLRGADLEGAILQGASLRGTNLQGVRLYATTGILSFYLGKHFGFMTPHNQYVKIGCAGHSLDYWLEHYKEIGKENGYSNEMIKCYGIQLRALKEIVDE